MKQFIKVIILLVLFFAFFPVVVQADLYTPKQRFGLGVNGEHSNQALKNLNLGWEMNWGYKRYNNFSEIEYAPMIGVSAGFNEFTSYKEFKSKILEEKVNNPQITAAGTAFLIGNEIGLRVASGGEDYPAAAYVDKLKKYIGYITRLETELGVDLKIAFGSVIPGFDVHIKRKNPEELVNGVEYAQSVISQYQQKYGTKPPVDIFQVHPYNFLTTATNFDKFKNQITAYRNFMKRNGYQDKELWITEWGNLDDESQQSETTFAKGMDYMVKTVDWLWSSKDANLGMPSDGNRLVQRWAWFTFIKGDNRSWRFTYLLDASDNLSLNSLGKKYQSLIFDISNGITPTDTPTGVPSGMPTSTPSGTITPTNTPTPDNLKADLDGDKKVDMFDFNVFVKQIGKEGKNKADLDGDKKVNLKDFNILVELLIAAYKK